jgi:hypothetical protein
VILSLNFIEPAVLWDPLLGNVSSDMILTLEL